MEIVANRQLLDSIALGDNPHRLRDEKALTQSGHG